MLKDDRKLKVYLVLQSFCPLFILLLIRHIGAYGSLIIKFIKGPFWGEGSVWKKVCDCDVLGDVVITAICITWLIGTIIVGLGFKNLQHVGYDHYGETIIVKEEKKDSGVNFLVSFVLPLLMDDVTTFRGFLFFALLLSMVICLVMRTDMFYQNPVLAALKYKVYTFQFNNPYNDVDENREYIGITKGNIPDSKVNIKRRYIADGVFIITDD